MHSRVLTRVRTGFCPYLRPGPLTSAVHVSPLAPYPARLAQKPCGSTPPERQSRTDIGERNTDELEMTGVALCSKSFIVGDTQLVTGSSSGIHQAAMQEQI